MKDYGFLQQNIIAHRGDHNKQKHIIENTLEAFEKAIEKGYLIELDIRRLKDNTIVVFHDDNLKRLAGIDKKVSELTFDEIKQVNLLDTNSKIPTLEEVLNMVDGRVPILIEIKSNFKVGVLEKDLSRLLKKYKGKFAIQSFNPLSLRWFKINNPKILRGQLSYGYNKLKNKPIQRFVMKNMLLNFLSSPDFISYKVADISKEKVLKIKKKMPILGWTVDNKEDYEKYKSTYTNLICEKFI